MAAVPSALGKDKRQAVWWKPYRFVFRGCSSFPDRFARLELSALAERFDAQIRVEKTPCGSRAAALGKDKRQAVWVEALPLLFCMRYSSFSDRLDAGEIIRRTDSGKENAMWKPFHLHWKK